MWKPGQIVTIEGVRYRVKRLRKELSHSFTPCDFCMIAPCHMRGWIDTCAKLCTGPLVKVPRDCYLIKIKNQ